MSVFGLNRAKEKSEKTDNNKEYKIARKLSQDGGVDCIICMGRCGYGSRRSNGYKKNSGKMPKYKNRKKGIKNLIINEVY